MMLILIIVTARELPGQHLLQGIGAADPGRRGGVTSPIRRPSSASRPRHVPRHHGQSEPDRAPGRCWSARRSPCSCLTLWAYCAEAPRDPSGAGDGWRSGLRLLAVLLCLLAALRPSVILQEKKRQAASLVFLVDSSTSMTFSRRGQRPDPLGRGAEDPGAGARGGQVARPQPRGQVLSVRRRRSSEPKADEQARPSPRAARPASARPCSRPRSARPRTTSGSPGWSILSDFASNSGDQPRWSPPAASATSRSRWSRSASASENAGADRATSPSARSSTAPTVFVKNQLEVRGTLSARGFAGQTIDVELLVEGQPTPSPRPRSRSPRGPMPSRSRV